MNDNDVKDRILVVDDHPHSRQLVERLLRNAGFDTCTVESGSEAMNLLADGQFDAVVSDVEMPGMSGLELLRHIRLRYPQMPVVLMTPFHTEELREAGIAWGAVEVLKKPFTGVVLKSVLHRAIAPRGDSELVTA